MTPVRHEAQRTFSTTRGWNPKQPVSETPTEMMRMRPRLHLHLSDSMPNVPAAEFLPPLNHPEVCLSADTGPNSCQGGCWVAEMVTRAAGQKN